MAEKTINKLIKKYQSRFGIHGGDKVRESFKEELAYESGKLFITVFIGLVAWLPYIRHDFILHQFPQFVLALRIGLSILCICMILLRFTKKFHHNPSVLLMIFVAYFYIATSLLTATSGIYVSSYIGGYIFIMMMLIIGPFSFKFKAISSICSFILFFIMGFFIGLDFKAPHINYSVTDLFIALVTSLALNYIHNKLRYRTWLQRYELQEMVKKEQENLKTISELAKHAEEANKAKSNFLATMSHEIRTPLNAILGIAQIQLQKNDLPDDYTEALKKIHRSGNSLLGIINDVLDLSKIETGKMEINLLEYDIPSLIHDAVQVNIVRIGSKPIEFVLIIDENLPLKLIGDELRIKQILNNLLSNAIKYTEKGYVKLTVNYNEIDQINNNITINFIVEDTGYGMKPNDCEKLFSEYLRFNTGANRTTEGTGLGLNITKKLTELMEGTIKVESIYGKGSIFSVTIKQHIQDFTPIGSHLSQQLQNFTFSGEKQHADLQILREHMPYGKILIVDDVETNLYVAEGLLSPYKLKIETAISGFDAIDKVKDGSTYDIIFMDHIMPLMDGLEATHKLRSMNYNGTIVALTANAITGNKDMFLQKGFDEFIAKPIDLRQLNSILNKFIRDKYPEEANKYRTETFIDKNISVQTEKQKINPKMLEIFKRDAEKAILTLRWTYTNGDIKLFTTTAHAMKSALANISENEKSNKAFLLEKAGLDGDLDYINANADTFIKSLEKLIQDLNKQEYNDEENEDNIKEDIIYLKEQIQLILSSCNDYNDTQAFITLKNLKEKKWKKETIKTFDIIYDTLFLHSDFDNAKEQASILLNKIQLIKDK